MVIIVIVVTLLWAKCYFGGSGCCKQPELVGNGKCNHHLMNQAICNYDNEDCCQMDKTGDRICDDFNNNPLCREYDGGDCYLKNKCNHDGGNCCDLELMGDRLCHDVNNFDTCQHDGDDCHPPDVTEWPNCLHNPNFIGDGICDNHLKHKVECNNDGFDCKY